MELQHAVAIVTGGTGGLGQRIVRALAARGVHVAICYATRQGEAEEVARAARTLGVEATAVALDVSSPASVLRAIDRVVQEFGRIDVLVNDAAYNTWIPFPQLQDLDLETWNRILTVNLTGPFVCSKAVAPIMKRQGRGRIVNIGSIAGLHPTGSSIAYAVSKAGLTHLTRCLAVALAPEVQVNCVAPGFMEGTQMSDNLSPEYRQRARQNALLQRATDKGDVAEAVVEFCRTDSITGQTLVVDSGRIFH
jgi:3-oxoacyl-[acyl-carrier protein] reductase